MLFLRYCGPAALLVLLAGAAPALAQLPTDTTRASASPELALLNNVPKLADCAHPFGLRDKQNVDYQLLDAKGKLTGMLRYQVVSLSTEVKGKKKPHSVTTVQLQSGLYDANNKVQQQQDLTIRCERDTTYTDGLAEINYDGLKSFQGRLLAYKGHEIAWPNQPTAGSTLPGGGVVVQVSSPSVAIAKIKTTLKSRKVRGGLVPVTVPAGTFSCYQVESQRELANVARVDLTLKTTGRQVDYYAPAVGIVKTEYFDKNDKLLQTRVLAKH